MCTLLLDAGPLTVVRFRPGAWNPGRFFFSLHSDTAPDPQGSHRHRAG